MGPSHCDLSGNERTDQVAKEAAELPQEQVPVDVTTNCRAVARTAREQTIEHWPPGWLQRLMRGHIPPPVIGLDRQSAIDVLQLRAGHWSQFRSYLHRIGWHPTSNCESCNDDGCPAMLCPICREEPDGPDHIALRCPALMRIRYRETGTTNPTEEGGPGDRRGGGPGGRRQTLPEPGGYVRLTSDGGNINNKGVRTCRCAQHLACVRLIEWVPSHAPNFNIILPAVCETWTMGVHMRMCKCITSLTCVKLLSNLMGP